jgi:hypothetical protein
MSADAIGAHSRHFVWSIKPGACVIANGFSTVISNPIFGINDGQFGLPKPTDDRRNRELVIKGAQYGRPTPIVSRDRREGFLG